MATSVSGVSNHFPSAENGFTTTTSGSVSSGATTVGLNSVSGYATGEAVVFIIDPDDATKKQTFTGIMDAAGSQVTGVVWTSGTNQAHVAGATVVDYPDATHISMVTKGLLVQHKQDGTHANTITTDTINENTSANGVTVDSLNIKDGKLNTNDSVVTANITDANVTSAKLAEAFFRGKHQAITTNTTPTGLTVQYGWSFIPGTGADEATKTITFPSAFSAAPIYVGMTVLGFHTTTPTAITDFTGQTGSGPFSYTASDITTTNFVAQISRSDAVTFDSSVVPGFTWMAIGTV